MALQSFQPQNAIPYVPTVTMGMLMYGKKKDILYTPLSKRRGSVLLICAPLRGTKSPSKEAMQMKSQPKSRQATPKFNPEQIPWNINSWICSLCDYVNPSSESLCEMCDTPNINVLSTSSQPKVTTSRQGTQVNVYHHTTSTIFLKQQSQTHVCFHVLKNSGYITYFLTISSGNEEFNAK